LEAQHRPAPKLQTKSAEPVVNTGPSEREKELLAEIEKLKLAAQTPAADKPPKNKPGPKAKPKPALEGATV
jgi:hypothetical protein